MPIFDFLCNNCGQVFDIMIKNDEKEKVRCPQCQSIEVKQQLSAFYSAGKSAAKSTPMPMPSCGGCAAAKG